jgi:ATP-dependent RNA helicase DeaD
MIKFSDLGLSDNILNALNKKGFEAPTPIQEQVIPLLLGSDKDIIGQAYTGTGKTAAFGIPLIENLSAESQTIQALIMTPTRELAIQVAEEIHSIKGEKKLKIIPFYGGQSIQLQMKHLKKGVHIIVGTPGRLLDHLRRKSLKLNNIEYCILDEADEMLNMGFLEDVEAILQHMPTEKRMLLFSATMPQAIMKIAQKYMQNCTTVKIQKKQLTVAQTDQIYFEVSYADRFEALCRIIDIEPEFYGLIFCRTKVDTDSVASRMLDRGYDVDALHGDLSQPQREKIMTKFKKRRINILVATDVAARGLDVQDLTHVINYALPQDPEAYVHRIGRTGRAGKQGTAITFITPVEYRKLQFIQQKTKTTIRKDQLPKIRQVIRAKKFKIIQEVEEIIKSELYSDYLVMAEKLLQTNEPEQIIAALFKHAYKDELDKSQYNEIRGGQKKIQGETRLFIAKGRKHGMTHKKLIQFITTNASVKPSKIQDISIQDSFSFISTPFHEAENILNAFNNERKGKRPMVTKAKKKAN